MVRILELNKPKLKFKTLRPGMVTSISGKPASDNEKNYLKNISYADKTINGLTAELSMGKVWNPVDGTITDMNPQVRARHEKAIEQLKTERKLKSNKFTKLVDKIIPYIENHCSNFLPVLHNHGFLYRGIHQDRAPDNNGLVVFLGNTRNDRKAKDSDQSMQAIFDKMLEKLKFKALRGNSIFITSVYGIAKSYGLPYVIIPCNDVSYCWSKKMDDIVLNHESDVGEASIMDVMDAIKHGVDLTGKKLMKPTELFQSCFDITDRRLDMAMHKQHEIWMTGHYIAVSTHLAPYLSQKLFNIPIQHPDDTLYND